jgi:hypothetical protein
MLVRADRDQKKWSVPANLSVVLSLNSFFRYSSCSSDIGYVPFFLVFVIMHFSCAACAMCYLKKHVALVMSPTSKSLCWASYLNCPAYDTILLASLIWTLLVVLFLFTYGCGKIYDRFLIYGLYTLTVTCRHATFFSAEWRKREFWLNMFFLLLSSVIGLLHDLLTLFYSNTWLAFSPW